MFQAPKSNVHLILRNTDALSGTPRILLRQAKLLADLGAKVSVISETFSPEITNDPRIKTKKIFRWFKNGLFQRRFFDWQTKYKTKGHGLVIGHGDSLNQDILFIHTCVHKAADLNPGDSKKNYSIPFHRMIFEHGRFKLLVCNSKMMRDDLVQRFNIKVPTHILYPGHDLNLKNSINSEKVHDLRRVVTKNRNKIILGVITSGNLDNRGAFALIRAAGLLPKEIQEKIAILIVGKESRPERIYQLAEQCGIKDLVHWTSPRPDVANLIMAADVVVHAAKMEAFGMSVLESMALARPIICTRTVGCNELFPEIQKEFIIDAQSETLIANAVTRILEKQESWKEMGETNARIAQNYSWENFDRKFLDILSTFN